MPGETGVVHVCAPDRLAQAECHVRMVSLWLVKVPRPPGVFAPEWFGAAPTGG
jgi:hypothetical protein